MSFWDIKGVMLRTIRHIAGADEWVEVRCFTTVTHHQVTMGDVVTLDGDARPAMQALPTVYGVIYKGGY